MLLITHLFIAFSSLVFTTYLYFSPSKAKFNVAYGLVGGTIVSGTALVITTHSPLLSSCVTGLVYLGIATFGIVASQRKFASEKAL
ncbi:MAG TPA: hypothetical protein VLE69_02185 [Candidatus Saccharimonadales bacterium]|nr:hypothetical protein [Candidatus Saccharimonadales bacterium]